VGVEIINLRRARKARAEAQTSAAENRAKHGVSKAERETTKRKKSQERSRLDAHRIGDSDDET
jgi:Domain of unknown function (DUF4169)